EVEPILARRLVDLSRVGEEAPIVEDLVEVPDERAAVPEVHQLSLELSGEGLHLRDPLVAVPADPVQLPLWRETEAFLNQAELIGWTAALHALMNRGRGRVHGRPRGPVDRAACGVGPRP